MRLLEWLDNRLEESILVGCLVTLSVLTIVNVITRYFSLYSLTWSEEICKLCLITSGFISIGYCVKHDLMLRLDVCLQYVGSGIRSLLERAVSVLLLGFFSIASYAALRVVQENLISQQESAVLRIPIFYIYLIAASGFGLALFRLLQRLAIKARKVGTDTKP